MLITALAVETQVQEGIITSPFFFIIFSEHSNALVHEFIEMAYFVPIYFAKFFSNIKLFLPCVNQPVLSEAFIALKSFRSIFDLKSGILAIKQLIQFY